MSTMRSTFLFLLLPVVIMSCAAVGIPAYNSLYDEAPPTWLPVPVAGVRATQLRDTWGATRSEGRTHEGIDIPARRGTPVLSATRGIVSAVQWRDRGGNTVSVRGPGGYSHYYAHLDSYGRYAEGDWVNAGDTIGFVGTTGNAQGSSPHLHYGIYTSEGAINPYPLLVAQKSDEAAPADGTSSGKSGKSTVSTTRPGRSSRMDPSAGSAAENNSEPGNSDGDIRVSRPRR